MEAIHAYYNGSVFVPLTPVKAKLNQTAIITVVDAIIPNPEANRYNDFFGVLSSESCSELIEALKDAERIDVDEW